MDDVLQLEVNLRDDGTSCTSSIATSASMADEVEELHLGAEANSFGRCEPKVNNSVNFLPRNAKTLKAASGKPLNNQIIVMRQTNCLVDSSEVDITYSAVSSVFDLLRAREGDPDEVLTNLGFADCHNEINKRSVLSRFQPSPLLNNEDNQFLTKAGNRKDNNLNLARTHYKESIDKAQEWLAHRHSDEDFKDKSNSSESNSINRSALPSKRPSLAKPNKWKRFSKSRQSSFELLLPNLKEEESSHEVEQTSARNAKITQHPSPIRESSIEFASMVTISGTDWTKKNHEAIPSPSPVTNKENKQHLLQDTFRKGDKISPAKPDEHKLTRSFKTSLLLASQRDSFELEEINSSNEEPADSCRRHRSGSNASTPNVRKQTSATNRRSSHSPNSEGGSENESSSGFGEDETAVPPAHSQTNRIENNFEMVSPHTVVESVQTEPLQGISGSIRAKSTRYVYDVDLGNSNNKSKEASICENHVHSDSNGLSSTNARLSPTTPFFRRWASSGALHTNYVPLRSAASWGQLRKPSEHIFVTSLPSYLNEKESEDSDLGKSPRVISDARRRRKEFAGRSALSGDSIVELFSSSLIRHNGSYSTRKQRPGRYHYFSSSLDSPLQNNFVNFSSSCNNALAFKNERASDETCIRDSNSNIALVQGTGEAQVTNDRRSMSAVALSDSPNPPKSPNEDNPNVCQPTFREHALDSSGVSLKSVCCQSEVAKNCGFKNRST